MPRIEVGRNRGASDRDRFKNGAQEGGATIQAPARGFALNYLFLEPLGIRSIGNRLADEAPPRKLTPQAAVWGSKREPQIARNFWQFRAR